MQYTGGPQSETEMEARIVMIAKALLTVRSMRAQVTPASSISTRVSTVWQAGPRVMSTAEGPGR